MDSSAWNKGLETGHPEIDQQHRTLFDALFRLKTALDGGDGDRELVRTFDFLKAYAAIHFRTEKEWMDRHAYDQAEAHREWHRHFTHQVKALADAPAGDPELKGAEVVRFLENWFVGHIQQEDLRMVAATREQLPEA